MIPRRGDELAQLLGGVVVQGDPAARANAVSIDSRTIAAGELFFAIRGATHDGHRFLGDVAARGVTLAIVDQEIAAPPTVTTIRVADTTIALGQLARDERIRRGYKVVAITGSSGKTTTRALTTAALSVGRRTASSVGNLNNQWGLPLSLLRLPDDTEAAVLEMGMNAPQEIAQLTRIARPDVGVITNVGTAHLGNFPDERAIAAAKCELLDEMDARGIGVVHLGSPLLMERAASAKQRLIRFGCEPNADLRAEQLAGDLLTGSRFTVRGTLVQLALWGRHAVLNALAALGAGLALGDDLAALVPALRTVTPLAGRGRLVQLEHGILVVDESYNANPTAMIAVLEGLAASPWSGRRVAVLGDMRELGSRAAEFHRQIGAVAARCGIDLLHAVGEQAKAMAEGARAAGLTTVVLHADAAQAARAVPATLRSGDLVVIKASRGTGLDVVLAALPGSAATEEHA